MRRLTLKHFFVLWISGVSAQSFIHAFTLTHSVFNVQIATPQVRKIINQLRAVISISLGHSFSIRASAPIDRGTLNFTPPQKSKLCTPSPTPLLLVSADTVLPSEFLKNQRHFYTVTYPLRNGLQRPPHSPGREPRGSVNISGMAYFTPHSSCFNCQGSPEIICPLRSMLEST